MYRNNPLHTGVATDVVSPPLNLKWKQTFGGAVDSSPAVVGSRLYVGSDDGNLYAIDTATGNIIWTFNDAGATLPAANCGGAGLPCPWESSPAVATVGGQTVIFAGNDNNKLYAVRDDGTAPFKLWEYTTIGAMPVRSSPVVTTIAGTQVVIFGADDDRLYALVASTGALYGGWPTNPYTPAGGGKFVTSPAILGQTIFIGSTDKKMYAVNLGNGVPLWIYPTIGGGAGGLIYSSPAVANVVVGGVPTDLVFFGSDDKNLYALVAASGVKQWSFTVGGKIDSSPAVAVIPNPPPLSACTPGPTLAVIFGSFDHNLYAVRASDGTPCWTFPSTGAQPFSSSPTVSGQTVYVGSDDNNVYAVDINTGTWRWSYPALKPVGDLTVAPNPVVSGTRLYVGSKDSSLYAFEAVAPTTVTSTVTSAVTSTVTSAVTSTVTTTIAATTVTTTVTSMETTTSMVTQTVSICPGPSPVPGFPIESILAGLVAGVAALGFLRHRHRRREARGSED
jgi:outer membrane protein assembly factor BamB